ncbi:CpaE-like family protein [Nesterenkonia populi]|uniref:hypothetical protein n=1 Tax=Nesterenkonia populi TaxID=1591087 RepID=UPI0011BDD152|nr:hypothetical protein [Nesterenkonia populi]
MRSEPEEPRLLLVTEDEQLRDDIALIAAVVGARLDVRAGWRDTDPSTTGEWAALLCGPDAPPPRGLGQTLLVGREAEALWAAAALAPQAAPVPLPAGEAWLSEHLSAKVLNRAEGSVVAVAGAVGGAGATTAAYLLAAEAAVRGDRVLLLDAEAGAGSGLHHLLEHARAGGGVRGEGLELPQLIATEGEVSSAHLTRAVPVVDGVHLLTGGPETDAAQLRARLETILRAGARAFDLVVLDLGRAALWTSVAEQADHLLVVTRPTPRAAAAAGQILDAAPGQPAAVMANGRPAPGWGLGELEQALGAEVAADLAEQRWMRAADDPSAAYELLRAAHGARLIGGLLERLAGDFDHQHRAVPRV